MTGSADMEHRRLKIAEMEVCASLKVTQLESGSDSETEVWNMLMITPNPALIVIGLSGQSVQRR